MGSVLSTATWAQLSGDLAAAVNRDFERAVLPLVRAFWPAMVQPPALATLDVEGVDLIAFGEGDEIECIVQCKGFKVEEGLADKQVRPIEKSIAAFRNSSLKTDEYVLLHNRDGRNRQAALAVDAALATLVTEGKAKRVRQWDRHSFLLALAGRLREMVATRVREESTALLRRIDQTFAFGRTFVSDVPIHERELILGIGQGAHIRELRKSRRAGNIAELLAGVGGREWILLTGLFGSGKTTATLHAAALHPERVLYVYGGSIEALRDIGGTNILMSRILDSLSVFADFPDEERAIFNRLAGPVLRSLLSANDARDVLIIDALDENKRLSTPAQITAFASSLAELNCSIIMTTREEHFRATFGNYEHLFSGLSMKRGAAWSIKLVGLRPWTGREVGGFAAAAAAEAPENEALAAFARDVASGGTGGWDPDLLHHPLFLRMIIELVAEGVAARGGRASIIARWARAKLIRDLSTDRLLPVEVRDRDSFIGEMELLMSRAAARMVAQEEGRLELTESLPSDEIIALAEEVLKVPRIDLAGAIAVSLLMPAAVRYVRTVPVRFTHRLFQEYHLAVHLHRTGQDPHAYPSAVKELVEELRAGDI